MSLHADFEISSIYSYYKKNHELCVQFYCLHFCPCFLLYCRSVRLFLEREPNKHMSSLQFQKQTTQALCHFLCRPPLHSTAQKTKVAQVLPLKLRPNGGRHIINFKILQIKLVEGYRQYYHEKKYFSQQFEKNYEHFFGYTIQLIGIFQWLLASVLTFAIF